MTTICQIKYHLICTHSVMVNQSIQFGIFGIRIALASSEFLPQSVKRFFCGLKFLSSMKYLLTSCYQSPRFPRIADTRFAVLSWNLQQTEIIEQFSIFINCQPIIQNHGLPWMRCQVIRRGQLSGKATFCPFIITRISICGDLIPLSIH